MCAYPAELRQYVLHAWMPSRMEGVQARLADCRQNMIKPAPAASCPCVFLRAQLSSPCAVKPTCRGADSARKSAPDSDDDEYWPGQGVERSTSSVLQTRSGNAHGQSKGAKYRHVPPRSNPLLAC